MFVDNFGGIVLLNFRLQHSLLRQHSVTKAQHWEVKSSPARQQSCVMPCKQSQSNAKSYEFGFQSKHSFKLGNA